MQRIAVIGLGYVGLPVALAFARRYPGTVGYDRDEPKVHRLRAGDDPSGQASAEELSGGLVVTADPADLANANFYIVAVPTPIDGQHRPDLTALRAASRTVGQALSRGDIVVYESTVYPGATEEVCAPILAETSGLRCGEDFTVAYSPERINPGDPEHTFERIPKVVAGQDGKTLDVVAECYGAVVQADLHRAPSIRVAEAAKVIENVQRDLNIALMNELALILDRLDIDTRDVLEAAATKWNFHHYRPGLVGGHCIGVDPYYLTSKAEEVGIHPQVILAGRRINDGMGVFVASSALKQLAKAGRRIAGARVALLGLAFKPNVPDLRNSRVPDIFRELREYGVEVLVHDPLVDPAMAISEYGIELVARSALRELDGVVLAIPHEGLGALALELVRDAAPGMPLVDVMWGVDPRDLPEGSPYWRL